jgi:3-dehydrotetronate 4-kinase
MLELAVLADDLTGGMIVASLLEGAGVVCPLVTDASCVDKITGSPTAIVLARKIRLVAADVARKEADSAAAAFIRRDARTVYYKYSALFDSTPNGNIGPIAENLLRATGADRTIFCPAWVDMVTVYKGHVFVGHMLMSDSFKRFDPVTPAETANIVVKLAGQTAVSVGLLDHQMLNRELAVVHDFLRDHEESFWIADAVDSADVARLAALTRDWRLVTGGDSLPPAIIKERRKKLPPEAHSGRRLLPASHGFEAVLAGSCHPATRAQVEAFARKHPVWRIDLARHGGAADLIDRIVAWARENLCRGPIGIATTADPRDVKDAQQAFGREGASELADRLMSDLASQLRDLGVRKFVIAGGETSGAIFRALGIRQLEVAAYDTELFGGYCHSARDAASSFVLKPGSIGDEQFFFRALKRMREADEQVDKE